MNSTNWGIALGYFDGVHIGHRQLINRLCRQSSELDLKTMVFTFDRHPQNVISPQNIVPLIYSPEDKYRLLCDLDVDRVEMIPFDIQTSKMQPQDFFEKVLIEKYNVKYVVVGFNFKFGHRGKGDVDLLKLLGEKNGVRVDVVKPVSLDGQLVSSSYIRELLRDGNIKIANSCLGRNYTVSGKVIKGKGRGNRMGIPTANIRLPEEVLYPAKGVYITNTIYQGKRYPSITNVGVNPTFPDGLLGIETYIDGLHTDLYGCFIQVEFFDRIREEKKFNSKEELFKQIELDIKYLENYFYQSK